MKKYFTGENIWHSLAELVFWIRIHLLRNNSIFVEKDYKVGDVVHFTRMGALEHYCHDQVSRHAAIRRAKGIGF